MTHFYLTPASISFLVQFILAGTISVFLINRLYKKRTFQLFLLTGFFSMATSFIGFLFLDASLAPYWRLLIAVYPQNTALALALVFLIQFAFHFPKPYPQYKWARIASLIVSTAYFLWEGCYMIYRYKALLGQEMVYFRPIFSAYIMVMVMVLPPITFICQAVAADQRPINPLLKLWRPEGKGALGALAFAGVFGIVFLLGIVDIGLTVGLSRTVYNAALSIGVLVALWLFASNYINFIPGGVSVQFKVLTLSQTIFLAIIGSAGWFIAPNYVNTFSANLLDRQTLRFTPRPEGSYQVSEITFSFDQNLGERLSIPRTDKYINEKIDFRFPFFGQVYDEVYVSSYGVVTMGESFWEPNMQASAATFPAIFPLLIDLDPEAASIEGNGIFARYDEDGEKLVVTWNKMPAFYKPEAVFTFQLALYKDGTFDISYNGLPPSLVFDPDANPRDNPWLRGAVSGQGEPLYTNANALLFTAESGGYPLLENYHLAFRNYLSKFMLPFAQLAIGGSLLMIIGLPLLLRYSIVRPLNTLTDGVAQMEHGNLSVKLPVQHEDEIGYLTHGFNTMAAQLEKSVTNLEMLVTERTSELTSANENLQKQLETTELLRAELKEQSIRDPLTNAYNRRYLTETLERELSLARRNGYPLSLVMFDVDHFKKLNDCHGHLAGDFVLQEIIALVMGITRKEDVVCRFGGEEFVVLLPGMTSKDAYRRAEEWRIACQDKKFVCDDKTINTTLSLGIVTYPDHGQNSEQLLKMVDQSMYDAKDAGRNCTVLCDQDITESA